MMFLRVVSSVAIAIGLVVASAAPTAAQGRSDVGSPVPAPGMVAVGASVGAAPPLEASFTNGFDLAANIERYLTRRVSLRAQLSGAFWDITGRGFTGSVHPIALDGNVVYNWEGGKIHPFATGGVGLYHYRFEEHPTTGSANKFGINVGGGVEYFINRYLTGTAEVLFHDVADPVKSPLTTYNDSSYWTFTVGLKKYFKQ